MLQHKENDFIIPALLTINACKEECTTDYIKRNVGKYIELTEMDLKPYPSRSSNEPRYYQLVGNLISHRNPTLFTYIDQIISDKNIGKKSLIKFFVLNDNGKKYVKELLSDTSSEKETLNKPTATTLPYINDEAKADFTIIDPFDEKIMEFALKNGLAKRPPTDSKIATTVIELNNYKCEYAMSIGKRHSLFIGKSKHPFMEGHHLVPMKAAKDFFPLNLDRPSNVISLCPGCHSLLHHATREEKEKVLKVLYNNHIQQLNSDGIYISFEKLLNKYY